MSKIFARNLRAYRMMADMTQDDIARAVGVTRNVIANYEVGRSEPGFDTLCRFASVLGVGVEDLVTEHLEYPEYTRRMQVTDEEAALLQAYRDADDVYRGVAVDILRTHKKGRK